MEDHYWTASFPGSCLYFHNGGMPGEQVEAVQEDRQAEERPCCDSLTGRSCRSNVNHFLCYEADDGYCEETGKMIRAALPVEYRWGGFFCV